MRLKRSLSLSLSTNANADENASSSSSHFRVIVLVRAFRSRDRFRPSRLHHPSGVVVVVVHRLRLRPVDDHHLLWQHVLLRVHRTQLPSVARTQTHEKRKRTDQQRRPETRETRNRAEILFLDEEEPRVPRVGGHDGVAHDDARHVFAPRRRLFTVVENIFSNWTRNALHFLCRL